MRKLISIDPTVPGPPRSSTSLPASGGPALGTLQGARPGPARAATTAARLAAAPGVRQAVAARVTDDVCPCARTPRPAYAAAALLLLLGLGIVVSGRPADVEPAIPAE